MTKPPTKLSGTAEMAQAILDGRHFSKQLEGIPAIAIDDAVKLAKAHLAVREALERMVRHTPVDTLSFEQVRELGRETLERT